jgi:uncharacterized protein (DUF1778 family)
MQKQNREGLQWSRSRQSEEAERLTLSERDSLRVLDLLENPPPAPDSLVRTAKAGFALP